MVAPPPKGSESAEALRVAVVGVGWAGARHVEAIDELGRGLVVECLVDVDAPFLAEQAARLGVEKTYIDCREALDDAAVEAVSICSPHPLHCAQAVAAAEAGKHVLVEKPMAMDVAEATRMIEAAEVNGVQLYVAENAVYVPMAQRLRQIVRDGEFIGELVSASLINGFRAPTYGYPGRRAWLAEPAQGGRGTWTLHGIHTVAQMRYALGEVRTVYVQEHKASSYQRRDIEGTMSGLLTLESGVHVHIVQTPEVKLYGELGGYVLHGDRGSIRATEAGFCVYNDAHDGAQMAYPDGELSSYALEMAAFADGIMRGVEGPTTGYSERRSLAVVQAGYESAERGLPVDIPSRFGPL